MLELREMGVRTVPVAARGRDYVFAQALEDVSRDAGPRAQLPRPRLPRLPDCRGFARGG
jgi:hypothetical protein